MHIGITEPGTLQSLDKEQPIAGLLHCNETVPNSPLLNGICISGRLFTLGFVCVWVWVAQDFLVVSALRAAMEYCAARDMFALFFLYFRISTLRLWSNSYVLYGGAAFAHAA